MRPDDSSGSSDMTPPPLDPEVASVWLEHVRWVWEKERVIYDGLGQRAVALLSLNGVLLALLANAETMAHGATRAVLFVAVWIALVSAILALSALPQRARYPVPVGLHDMWRERYAKLGGATPAEGITEMLMRTDQSSTGPQVGPIAELRDAVRRRGTLTVLSGRCATIAIGLVAMAITLRG